jgi:hypothetical protein
MKLAKGLIFCLVAFLPTLLPTGNDALAAAKTWYVDASVSHSGDGTSWQKAFKTIQEGIGAASDGDTVTVAQGTYQENVQFNGKNIVLTGTDVLNPDVIAKTIIQGRQLGPTVTFSGTESASCVLSGFTVWDGKAENGGAILGNGTHATIGLNVITGGTADNYGGALCGCDGLIHLNIITVNSSGVRGGGLANCNGPIQFNIISFCWSGEGGGLYQCHGPIQYNTITDCAASTYGGGLSACYGDILSNTIARCSAATGGGLAYCGKWVDYSARIANNTITENKATGEGGGMYYGKGTIENNTITKNTATDGAGLDMCIGPIQNNRILMNAATSNGGGLFKCYEGILNNLIAGNSAEFGGGLRVCHTEIQNNTIVFNSASWSGGGLDLCEGTITNCIIWGNKGQQFGSQVSVPTYSCIEGGTLGGVGNISQDPLFVSSDGPDKDPNTYNDNDYRLADGSPCIDKGTNLPWVWTARDLDGFVRAAYGNSSKTVDMGAYEYRSWTFKVTEVRKSGGQVQLTWSSRMGDTYTIVSSSTWPTTTWTIEATVVSLGTSSTWTDLNPGSPRKMYRIGAE